MSEEEKAELEELYENSEWWHNRFNAVQRDYENLQQRIDKAIELIKRSAGYKGICTQPETDTFSKLLEILGDKEND